MTPTETVAPPRVEPAQVAPPQVAPVQVEPQQVDLGDFFSRIENCQDKGTLTHGMHPYPAKFIPHIPRALIAAHAPPGGTVWDPMCGSGTALVEASISGRTAIGTDLNPIATLVSEAKTAQLDQCGHSLLIDLCARLEERRLCAELGQAVPESPLPEFPNRDHWFSAQVCAELADTKGLIEALPHDTAQTIALCSLSAILVGVSNQESETRWRAKPRPATAGEVYARLKAKILDSLSRLAKLAARRPAPVEVMREDARAVTLDDGSVDFVVTSPPYANAHDYYLYNKLRLFWLEHDVRPIQDAEIGSRNRHSDRKEGIGTYLQAMDEVMGEMARVLRPGGIASIVVADAVIRGDFYDMGDMLGESAAERGFSALERFSFAHTRFNSSFQRGFGTHFQKLTHVLVLRNS